MVETQTSAGTSLTLQLLLSYRLCHHGRNLSIYSVLTRWPSPKHQEFNPWQTWMLTVNYFILSSFLIPLHSLLQPFKGHLISPCHLPAVLETTVWRLSLGGIPVDSKYQILNWVFLPEWWNVPTRILITFSHNIIIKMTFIYINIGKKPIIVLAQCMQVPLALPLSVGPEVA